MTTKTRIFHGYRYRYEEYEGGEDEEGIGLVVQRFCPDTSSALALASPLAANTTTLVDIVLSDPASRMKAEAGAVSRRRNTTNNMMMGGRSSLRQLGLSFRIFGDGSGIYMVIGSDRQ